MHRPQRALDLLVAAPGSPAAPLTIAEAFRNDRAPAALMHVASSLAAQPDLPRITVGRPCVASDGQLKLFGDDAANTNNA